MMTPKAVRDLLRKQPFQPLEFRFSDGTVEQVRHPENVWLTFTEIGVGQFDDRAEFPEWMKTYALAHLVSVEPLQKQSA